MKKRIYMVPMVEVDDIMPEQMIAFSGESSDDVMITGADDGDDDNRSRLYFED